MSPDSRIAVVGFGGIFPGARDLAQYWDNIARGVDAAREVPRGRWLLSPAHAHDPGVATPDHVYSTRGCFLDDFTLDPRGLDIDLSLVSALDPMFHIALHAARDAVESAPAFDRARAGVILGNIALPTESASRLARRVLGQTLDERLGRAAAIDDATPGHPYNRFVAGLPGAVVARALGLGRGSYTLDAACASSLYAVKLAAEELRAGRADVMLAGGLSRPDCLYTQMGFAQLRALSKRGRCAPFDASGDGLVVGEGAGVVVLKRLDDALSSGDTIHAVLTGFGLSNDVEGSLLAPSSEGQLRAMRPVYRENGLTAQDIDLIECHATGTPVGDAVEIQSLKALWGERGWERGQCVIGGVKSNVGHLLTGAGAAGMIKVLLALKHQTLPPTANFTAPGPALELESSPFTVLAESRPWERRDASTPRRAALNAFGFGGINAHITLEEWLAPATGPRSTGAATRESSPPAPLHEWRGERGDGIAIVGLAARLGGAANLGAVRERALGLVEPPPPRSPSRWFGVDTSRWLAAERGDAPPLRGHWLADLEIPLDRFRIPPKELEETLPQQTLMLVVADEAVRDARLPDDVRLRTGVFIGIELDLNTTNFSFRWSLLERGETGLASVVSPALNANRTMGALGGIVASRVARELKLGGPSFTLSAEETSGLSAVAAAVRALERGELDYAIAGAVEVADVRAVVARDDRDATTIGEGAAAVVLKRVADARRDGDRIYAVIKGIASAVSRAGDDGTTQRSALERALLDAHAAAADLDYIEIAGASPASARDAAASVLDDSARVVLADTTATFGDCGAAAGLTGLVKVALALDAKVLPASRQTDSRFLVPARPEPWLQDRSADPPPPRRAALIAGGFGGESVHVIVEESVDRTTGIGAGREAATPAVARLLFATGSSRADLVLRLDELTREARSIPSLDAIHHRYRHRGKPGALALALVVRDPRDLNEALALLNGDPARADFERSFYREQPLGGDLAFVYPGSGSHYPGQGRELALTFPWAVAQQERENRRLRRQLALDGLHPGTATPLEIIFGQVALGTLASDVLFGFGVRPQAVIGYSLGESAGLFSLRAWRDRDLMLARMEESSLFQSDLVPPYAAARRHWRLGESEPCEWTAGVVARSAEVMRDAIAGDSRLYVLIQNTYDECVLGGDRARVEKLIERLGVDFHELDHVPTVHCAIVAEVAGAYRALHRLPTTPPDDVRFYSVAAGGAITITEASAADSITNQAIHGFDFPKTIEAAYKSGVRTFLELGPGASCTRMVGRILSDRPHRARAVAHRGDFESRSVLKTLALLVAERVPLSLERLAPSAEPVELVSPSPERMLRIPLGHEPFAVPAESSPPGPLSMNGLSPLHSWRGAGGEDSVSAPDLAPLVASLGATASHRTLAHQTFLEFDAGLQATLARRVAFQMSLASALAGAGDDERIATPPRPWLDRDGCFALATGSLAKVLGPEFAEVDSFPTRVRLPDAPLMLVDRILEVRGEPRSMSHGGVVTEHDVRPGAWYLDCGRIPTCIAVEAGQADLFLSGYLGIDFVTRGLAVYRLLDATVTFHDALPGPGTTIRYDIAIERFFRQDDTHLFRFHFDGTVDGRPLITMREGCAGFFTQAELDAGKGIVHTDLDRRLIAGKITGGFSPLAPMARASYDEARLASLRAGDLAGAFGDLFRDLPLHCPVTIPGGTTRSGQLKLIDRVVELDPTGGRYGLGRIRAEADIHADDWFLTCHFSDDPVMPGTLMYECCLHTLRVFLLRLGWVGEEGQVSYHPVVGVPGRLKCRGQVTRSTRLAAYEISIKEIGYGPFDDAQGRPEPYAIADALMYADGKPIVEMIDLSIRLAGLSRADVETLWSHSPLSIHGEGPGVRTPDAPPGTPPPLYDARSILAFAVGKPSEAFGDRYRVFDAERVIARLPGPPYQFLDRVTEVSGEPWKMAAGASATAAYDVPPDAWYFAAERQPTMPFAVLLEVALQPCGWLAAYVGSALTSEVDLSFRNLGGSGTLHRHVTRASGTLTTAVRLTRVSSSAGMIIQNYDFEVRDASGVVYAGDTYFGFFSRQTLADQVGIRDAKRYVASAEELAAQLGPTPFPRVAPFPDDEVRMVDSIEVRAPHGGPHGLGFVRGAIAVDPGAWFFRAHFYQDPVWPGSLGLESFLQLLKLEAHERWGAERLRLATGARHEWVYRGQILPRDRRVVVEAMVSGVDEARRTITADGWLEVDGRLIYQMKGFALDAGDGA